MNDKKRFYLDLLERSVWSFVGAFASALTADSWTGGTIPDNVKVRFALGTAVFSVLKGFGANKLPWTAEDSASSLPASVDPPKED